MYTQEDDNQNLDHVSGEGSLNEDHNQQNNGDALHVEEPNLNDKCESQGEAAAKDNHHCKDQACQTEDLGEDSNSKPTQLRRTNSSKRINKALNQMVPQDIYEVFYMDFGWSLESKDTKPYFWAADIISHVMPEQLEDDSPSRREWLRMKAEKNEENPALDQLMSMVALEQVKSHFLAVKRRVEAAKARSGVEDLRERGLGLHLVLQGKNGTGKKTIAKLYAQFLSYIGAITEAPGELVCRVSYSTDNDALEASVVFLDLSDGGDEELVRWVLDRYVTGTRRPVIIVSARDSQVLETIEYDFDHRVRFPPPIKLPDYNEEELVQLLQRMASREGIMFEQSPALTGQTIVVQRALQRKASDDFRNIHELQKELQKVCNRRNLRLQKEEFDSSRQNSAESPLESRKHLTLEDVIGASRKDFKATNDAWKKLDTMIGLEGIKAECKNIIKFAEINQRQQRIGKPPFKMSLNRVLIGPPGVGKTTVAKLYGQILIDLGLVSGDEVIVRGPSDLIGQYIGQSEEKTADVLQKAFGQVLIIDDAHALYPGDLGGGHSTDIFRTAVIQTIVSKVSADPEDRCVILVGYEEEMEQMFLNVDKGLQRRFLKDTALRFDTYTEYELHQILQLKLQDTGLGMSEEAETVSRQILSRMRVNPKFGNAGDVENLIDQAKLRCLKEATSRLTSTEGDPASSFVIQPHHFDPDWNRLASAADRRSALFTDFVGFNQIIKLFEGYELLVSGLRLHNMDPRPHMPWAFTFIGPPGTGKTTTARKIGQLYYDLSLLSSSEVVERSASDLIADHQGGTGPKVRRVLETALSKVLFIDEAYLLASGAQGFEAVGELITAMTEKRYLNNMVIILAGYKDEMERLVRSNPGLRSRFPQQIAFPAMTPKAALTFLSNILRKTNITLVIAPELHEGRGSKVHLLLRKLSDTKGWANGRDIETLSRRVHGEVYMLQGRLGKVTPDLLQVTLEDLEPIVIDMLRERNSYQDDEG